MRGDLTSERHGERQVDGFKGLLTNLPDLRTVPPGYLRTAHNVVFDEAGNIRPRDGAASYWSATPQRLYLAEMELSEGVTWTNGAANSSVVKFGFQSRVINAAGATTMTRALPAAVDLTIGGFYAASQMQINFWVRAATPADITAATIKIASVGGFGVDDYSWNILSDINGLAANTWTLVTKTFASGTVTGSPVLTAITDLRLTITQTAGTNLYFDDVYVDYTNYARSYCLGQHQFRRISNSTRYHLAMFGETLYADTNEAGSPAKVKSQFTRNLPTYFETAEDRAFVFNGTDTPLVYTGTTYRNIGYTKPTTDSTLTPGGAGTGSMVDGVYHYGVTFIYGEGATVHGESSMREQATGATVATGGVNTGSVALTSIPVGALGAGVIKRRIYRSRVGAGANATKYYVTEIADNTTTSYTDTSADSTIILNAEGPTNNGVPPTARFAKWFQKGMVYFTNTGIYWSRPGTNLNETPETVPAENLITLGNAGEISGAYEFNGRLYVFQKRAIGKLIWRGSALEYQPVQRSGDSGAQTIGCHDQNAITVVADRYLIWKDPEGQDWKMLPNEEIFPESKDVANLCDDFNRLPTVGTFDYYVTDSEAQWNLGTVGSNLSTAFESGRLQYKDRTQQSSSGPSSTFSTQFAAATSGEAINAFGPFNIGSYNFFGSGVSGTDVYVKLTANRALNVTEIRLHGNPAVGFSVGGGSLDTYIAKYENLITANTLSTALGTSVVAQNNFNFTASADTIYVGCNLFIPQGESIILKITASGVGRYGLKCTNSPHLTNGDMSISGIQTAGTTFPNGIYPAIGITSAQADLTPQVTSSFDATTTLQRWFELIYTAVAVKAGKSIQIGFQVSSDNSNWVGYGNNQLPVNDAIRVYDIEALPGGTSMVSPPTKENRYLWAVPDYRVGASHPTASVQWRYGRLSIVIDPNRMCSPSSLANSGITAGTVTATFPSIQAPKMTRSTESSFATYDKTNYTNDIYTSETIDGIAIGSFGKFYADFTENQQVLTFQVITSATTNFSGSSWVTVTPNQNIPASAIVSSARYMKYRIIFQDDQNKLVGTPSYVDEIKISWAQGSAVIGPYMPPVLFYFKEYILSSWASRSSRIHDRSMALDAYKQTYEDTPHRYSTFGSPHYVNYTVANGSLIGAPASGGILLKLRNSDIADNNAAVSYGPLAVVETHPLTMGNYNLKILYWFYVGLQLGVFKNGFFMDSPGVYANASDGSTPNFDVIVSANKLSAGALSAGVGTPSALLIGSYAARRDVQQYVQQLSYSGDANSVANYGSFGPYLTEYGFGTGLMERAFCFRFSFRAFKDSSSNAWFPVLTGIGAEYHTETLRGV